MEGFTVHKLNDYLLVSLYKLPGFYKLGTCTVRNDQGEKSGQVTIYYAGTYFQKSLSQTEYQAVHKAVLKLAKNHAVKTKLGVATTRFNLATAPRKLIEANTVKDLNHAIASVISPLDQTPASRARRAAS